MIDQVTMPEGKNRRVQRGTGGTTPLDQALSRPLPSVIETADPLASAVPRLRKLAMLLAALSVMFVVMVTLIELGAIDMPFDPNLGFVYVTLGAAFVGSMVMIGLTLNRSRSTGWIIDAGMVFQVFGALCISLAEQHVTKPGVSMSMACIWILSFTLIPVSPQRAAIAAYASAFTGPIALAIHLAAGHRSWPPTQAEVLMFIPSLLSATIAVFINKVIYGLGRQVFDARQLGAYQMIEQLGQGGMGEVWRAEHESLIRPAAVKLLRREVTAHLNQAELEAMNLRFQREVQATALLTSPHTVAVYDFGHTSDGTLYYVMELLNGFDAETLVRKHGPQPAERVIHLLRQACESLAEAHHRSLIHRDIKPANIYLCAVGLSVDFVKVLDFGLVRDLNSNLRLTNEGSVSGTPAYLAPEAAAHNHFDARGDIYALGCVAYWLLTGKLVFGGETAAAVMAAHIRDKPEPPSKRTELAIPPALEALVMECLAKDPDARPQSAEELSRRLDAIEASGAWNQDRAQQWWRTHVPDLLGRARTLCTDEVPSKPEIRQRPCPVMRDRAARA